MTPRQREDPACLFRHEDAEIVRAQRNLTARVLCYLAAFHVNV